MLSKKDDCVNHPTFEKPTQPWCLKDTDHPDCIEPNACVDNYSPFIYFYSFTHIVSLVVLNLFVGVLLDAFDNCIEVDILNPEYLEKFTNTCAEFDPDYLVH